MFGFRNHIMNMVGGKCKYGTDDYKKAHENMISISGGIIKYETDDPTANDEDDCEDCEELEDDHSDELFEDEGDGYLIVSSPKVKIIPIENKITLECPSVAYVGKVFSCRTNDTKTVVKVSQNGLSDHYKSIFKKYGGKVITPKKIVNLMYTKKGYAVVAAGKKGSNVTTRIVEIRKR